jgi:ComEC/Rec2-related protein
VHLPWRNVVRVRQGSVVWFTATFRPLAPTPWPFEYDNHLLRSGVQATCKVQHLSEPDLPEPSMVELVRERLSRDVGAAGGEGEVGGLFLAMALGLKDRLSTDTEEAFRTAGLSHLLVLSGYQVTLVFGSSLALLRWGAGWIPVRIGVRLPIRRLTLLIAVVPTWGLVVLGGVDHSGVRAALAVALVVLRMWSERMTSFFNAILSSALLLTVLHPGILLDPGVQLTYAALTGIALGQDDSGGVREFLRISVCGTLLTAAVAGVWFGEVPLLGLLLNPILAGPIGALSCQGGAVALVLYESGVDSGALALRGVLAVTRGFRDVVVTMVTIVGPGVAFPAPWGVVLALLYPLLLGVRRVKRVVGSGGSP